MSISATTMHMLRALGVADPITNPTIISVFTWDKSTADSSTHRAAIWLDSNDAATPDSGFQFGTDGSDGYAVRIARGGTIEIFEETVNYWWQGGNRNTWKGAIGYLNGPAPAGDAGVFWHDATERTKAQDITGGNINATLADLYVLRNRLAKTGWGGGADSVQPNLRKAMVAVWVGYKLTDADRTALIGGAGVNTISPGSLKYVFSFGRSADDSATCLISGITLTPVGDAATITWHDADNPTAWVLEPTAQSVAESATAPFSVRALHAGVPTYQWQREPAAGGGFVNISGATSRTYAGAATLLANNGDKFRCVLNPGTGTEKISRSVTLTVTSAAGFVAGATLARTTAGGTLSAVASAFVAGATLARTNAGGTLGPAPGVITSQPLTTNNGTILASVALDYVDVYLEATGAFVGRFTSLSTNGSGVFTITSALLTPGTAYKLDWRAAGGHRRMPTANAA